MKRRGVLLIVLLIIAGVVAWYFWDKSKDNSSGTNSTLSVQNNDYLVIKEWGVRFKLPHDISNDVYYFYDKSADQVKFGSKKYAAIEPLCAADKIGLSTAFTRIIQGRQKPDSSTGPFKTLGNYVYLFVPSSLGCNQDNALSLQQSDAIGSEETTVTEAMQSTLQQI